MLALPEHRILFLAGGLIQALMLDHEAFPLVKMDRPCVLLVYAQAQRVFYGFHMIQQALANAL